MLSRSNSDAKARLHRSKSASSITPTKTHSQYPVSDHVNPWVEQQQALVAATTAFEKAYPNDGGLSRQKSSASRRSQEGSHLSNGGMLKRGSSARKSQDSGAAPARITARSRGNTISNVNAKPESAQKETAYTVPPRPATAQPNIRFEIPDTPTRSGPSEPPTSTRIRKARSMFYGIGRASQNTSEQTSPVFPSSPPVPQSISAPSLQAEPQPKQTSRDLSQIGGVTAARDKVLQDFQKGPNRRSSTFLGPFKKRQDKSKSTSRFQAHGVTFDSEQQPGDLLLDFEYAKDKKERSVSGSLRTKIRRLIRRTSSPRPQTPDFPQQQVEATRSYFGKPISAPVPQSVSNSGSLSQRFTEQSRLNSSTEQLPFRINSRQASYGSVQSEQSNNKSRVTSWGDSSAGDTVVNNGSTKRLSVIREGSQPSLVAAESSRPSTTSMLARKASKLFPEPKRIYSALLKEIAKKDVEVVDVQRVDVDKDGNTSTSVLDALPSQEQFRSRAASVTSKTSATTIQRRPTIRTVSPEPSEPAAIAERAKSVRGQVRLPPADSMTKGSSEDSSSDEGPSLPDAMSMYANTHRSSLSNPSILRGSKANPPSADQIATRVERANDRWKASLDDGRHSPFFSRNTRHAYGIDRPNSQAGPDAPAQPERGSFPPSISETHPNKFFGAEDSPRSAVSPSIYSRRTDGMSPSPERDSAISLPQQAVSFMDSVVIDTMPSGGPLSQQARGHSGKSSTDWKAWLSNEVGGLDSQEDITIRTNFETKKAGHCRELTQIASDESTLELPSMPEEPSEPTQQELTKATASSQPTLTKDITIPSEVMRAIEFAEPISSKGTNPSSEPPVRSSPKSSKRPANPRNSSSGASKPNSEKRSSRRMSRPLLENVAGKRASRMNDRFPHIETGRDSSRSTSRSSGERKKSSPEESSVKGSTKSATGTTKEQRRQSSPMLQVPEDKRRFSRRPSGQPRSKTSLACYTTCTKDAPNNRSPNRNSSPLPSTPPSAHVLNLDLGKDKQAKSAYDLREEFSDPNLGTDANVNRKPVTGRALEGDTLKMILEGPYQTALTPSPLSWKKARWNLKMENANSDKENSPSTPNWTPSHGNGESDSAKETPTTAGQRMAERFLASKRSSKDLMRGGRVKQQESIAREQSVVSDTPAFI